MSLTALKIEHIGSPAVMGLMSKPIIDILLVVPNPSAEASYALQLQQAGYTLRIREPGFQEHRMFLGIDPNIHLYVYGPDSQEAKDLILFRDWLRKNDTGRLKYQELKQKLATRRWPTVQDYADAKGPLICKIKQRAINNCKRD